MSVGYTPRSGGWCRLGARFRAPFLQRLACVEISEQDIVLVSTLAAGENADLKIFAGQNLQLVVQTLIGLPLLDWWQVCSLYKFAHEFVDVSIGGSVVTDIDGRHFSVEQSKREVSYVREFLFRL